MARLFDDASTEYMEKDAAPVTAYPLTMACWFYSDDAAADQGLMSIIDKDAPDQWLAALHARGGIAGDPVRASVRAGTQVNVVTTTGYSVNTWHHACGVFASTTSRDVFIDGDSKGSNTTSSSPSGVDRISVGRQGDSTPGNYMSGRIAEAAVWNVALNDFEIALLATPGITPNRIRPDNLRGYWPVWGLHSPEIDLSGQGNSLTVNGATRADHAPVTLFTPKWAASAPLIEVAVAGAGIRNPFGGPMVLRNPLGA